MAQRLIHGVGINDATYTVKVEETIGYIDGKRKQKLVWICPFYQTWKNMMERGYCRKFKDRRPNYKTVVVCEEWHRFSNFKAWMETQDWKGKQLDKDILVPGNKVYSPDTCAFVSARVNSFVLDSGAARGDWPIGVYLHRQSGKFHARSRYRGVRSLGYFNTPQEAHLSWAKAKRNLVDQLIIEENLEPRIANALITKYDEILTNAEKEAQCLNQILR